jgi:hypothetical protein
MMWKVKYWDDINHRWQVGLTTRHLASAEQLADWLRQIGWESRIDEGKGPELPVPRSWESSRPSRADSGADRSRAGRFWHTVPESVKRPRPEAETR